MKSEKDCQLFSMFHNWEDNWGSVINESWVYNVSISLVILWGCKAQHIPSPFIQISIRKNKSKIIKSFLFLLVYSLISWHYDSKFPSLPPDCTHSILPSTSSFPINSCSASLQRSDINPTWYIKVWYHQAPPIMMSQPTKRTHIPKAGKASESAPIPSVRSPTKTLNYSTVTCMQRS